MTGWQRPARLIIATGAVAFAIVLVFAFRGRDPREERPALPPPDPDAVVQGRGGEVLRFNRAQEEIKVFYNELVTDRDGTSTLTGVKVVTEREGRTFTVSGDEAIISDKATSYTMSGNVVAQASDGLMFRTDRATFFENEGIVRVPGRAEFSRGRMSGSTFGMSYDNNNDIAVLESQVRVTMAPGDGNDEALDLTASHAVLNRAEGALRFERGLTATRPSQTIQADAGVAYLTDDEERLKRVELRGNSRITGTDATPGSLQGMSGRDINLGYAEDGRTLQTADILGAAVVNISGERGQASRKLSAETLTVTLAADSTPTAVVGRDRVELVLPGETGKPDRTIRSRTLDATGREGQGLTSAGFTGSVQFEELGAGVDRGARSNALDVVLARGLGSIEDATFRGGVRFEDGDLTATSEQARYMLSKDSLQLSGAARGTPPPHVVNEQVTIDADRIDIALVGPVLHAAGNVKSELRPAEKTTPDEAARLPSMLEGDRPVIITAADLVFDEPNGTAVYKGTTERLAVLTQGETTIRGVSITYDDNKGDLSAAGSVTTAFTLEEERDGKVERTPSTATGNDFKYVEAERRAVYTGAARVKGPQGDLTAERIELFLEESGDELQKLEAYDTVTLRDKEWTFTGDRLTYLAESQVTVVTGAPVTMVDRCGRKQTALKLTHDRRADRITVENGIDQPRTQGGGRTQCP
jgi:LPS export ABC transporter protein LptC